MNWNQSLHMLESIETTVDHTFGELLASRIVTYIYPDAPKKKLTIVLRTGISRDNR